MERYRVFASGLGIHPNNTIACGVCVGQADNLSGATSIALKAYADLRLYSVVVWDTRKQYIVFKKSKVF
jgi:hypothetical protein